MKIIIIVEHNTPKEFLLKKAKERQIRVVMVANKFNDFFLKYLPKEDILITDAFNLHTITEDVLFFVKKRNLKIDAVGTFSEDLVIATADIASMLGCKTIGQLASRSTSCNKLAMRICLAENGIRQPKFDVFNIYSNDESILRKFPKPCVIKPLFGTSSHGVLMIENNSFDYQKIVDIVKATVNQEHRESFKRFHGNMLIEEYVPGKMLSFDGFVTSKKVSIVGSIEFVMSKEPYFTQVASYIPARLTVNERSFAEAYVKRVIKVLGFIDSPFHAELRIKDGCPYLIEIAGRMAGATIHETYNKVYNIDMLNLMFKCWLGNPIPKKYIPRGVNYHQLFYPKINKIGALADLNGLDEVKKLENVWMTRQMINIGDIVRIHPDLPTPLFEYAVFLKDLNTIYLTKERVAQMIKYKIV